MRETSIETLKRLERTIAKQAVELAELRSALADVRAMCKQALAGTAGAAFCVVKIEARLASLPPVVGGGE